MVSDSGLCGGNRPTVGNGCGLNNCKQITVWAIMLYLK
jgi:hypothetical protein